MHMMLHCYINIWSSISKKIYYMLSYYCINIFNIWLVVSTYPSEKYEFVSWDDDIPIRMESNKSHLPNHQPDIHDPLVLAFCRLLRRPTGSRSPDAVLENPCLCCGLPMQHGILPWISWVCLWNLGRFHGIAWGLIGCTMIIYDAMA